MAGWFGLNISKSRRSLARAAATSSMLCRQVQAGISWHYMNGAGRAIVDCFSHFVSTPPGDFDFCRELAIGWQARAKGLRPYGTASPEAQPIIVQWVDEITNRRVLAGGRPTTQGAANVLHGTQSLKSGGESWAGALGAMLPLSSPAIIPWSTEFEGYARWPAISMSM
jgi:hypothetical protein